MQIGEKRTYLNNDDVSAPTVATKSLLLTCLIDANKSRYVATVDTPGFFMHSDMEGDEFHIKLERKMVEILAKLNPSQLKKIPESLIKSN